MASSNTIPLPIRLAQTTALTTSLLLAGSTLTHSIYLIPRILESPTPLLLKQWKNTFLLGKNVAPKISLVALASYGYLVYATRIRKGINGSGGLGRAALGYAIAGVLSVGIVPFTVLAMNNVNNQLLQKAAETAASGLAEIGLGGESAHQLVDRWGILNLVRGGILTVAGVVGVWTVVNN